MTEYTDVFNTERTPFGRITVPGDLPPGLGVFFTGADFDGRLGDGVAAELSGWVRQRFSIDAPLSTCHQVHGATARRIETTGNWRELESCDALWSDQPRSVLAIKIADCVAVVAADLVSGVTLAFHAGWRGAAAGIVSSTITTVAHEAAFEPARARAWISPSIRGCCFEVGEEVIEAMRQLPTFDDERIDRSRGPRPHLDLPGVVASELTAAGIPGDAVVDPGVCTRCSEEFHSYRRDPSRGGRNLAVIAADGERMRMPA